MSLAVGALVLLGTAIPWFKGVDYAFTDDPGSSWPLLAIGVIAVLGGLDGLRGSLAGPAIAAGVGSTFVLFHATLLHVFDDVPGVSMGGGAAAWTLAAVGATVLAAGLLGTLRADRADGLAPPALGVAVVLAGLVWALGMVLPTDSHMSVSDHVELVLFGGDSLMDALTVGFIAFPLLFVVLAASTRSRAAHGLAAGSMAFWVLFSVSSVTTSGASLDDTVRYATSSFWLILFGALGVAFAGCLAMVLPSGTGAGAGAAGSIRPAFALVPLAGLVLLPIAGVVGTVEHTGNDDRFAVDTTGVFSDEGIYENDYDYEDDVPTGDGYGEVPYDESDTSGSGGAVDVVCTDEVDSSISSAWQDPDGAIHVIVLVNNDCGSGQQLDDFDAGFTLTSGGDTVADATFDFSSDPVVVPGYGSNETELVFEPSTFVDLGAVETLGLDDSDVGSGSTGSLSLTYRYTCTDVPDATPASTGGPPVSGDPTGTPIPAETTSDQDALARLGEIAAADEPFVEQDVLDRWVPQISSKKPDTTLPDGSVWDAVSILEDHRDWREQFPRVHLLWSGDYSTFELTDYWVTIVAVPFDTPEGALGWCDDHGLPDDDCYAKLISHTHPHEDSTRLR